MCICGNCNDIIIIIVVVVVVVKVLIMKMDDIK